MGDAEHRAESDDALIERYLSGDAEACAEVSGWIDAELRMGVSSRRLDRDDLKQSVHEKIVGNLRNGRFRGRSSFKTYVKRIAHHTAVDQLRRICTERRATSAGVVRIAASPHDELEQKERYRMAQEAIRTCSVESRRLLYMIFGERLSYKEVAVRLDIPLGTVKSRVHYCRRELSAALDRLERSGRGGESR